jgi:hypothetical protein
MPSKYNYLFEVIHSVNTLVITDEAFDGAYISVTNNIEKIVAELKEKAPEEFKKNGFLIIYRDSQGIYDGWDDDKQKFISINQVTKENAVGYWLEHYF